MQDNPEVAGQGNDGETTKETAGLCQHAVSENFLKFL